MAASSLGRPARSQALDDLIMGTNNSSIVSKRSVERLYYPNEPHFFRYFVKKFQRRPPLINRGYWLRLRAIDVIVKQFLESPSERTKVVINLGCGSDALPWQCRSRSAEACKNSVFVDVDYPDLMGKKRAIVLETPQLRELLGNDYIISQSESDHLLLRSDRYCQLACDLRELDSLRTSLESFLDLPTCEVLFVAEVSLTYMDTQSADSLLQWASSIGQAQFCLLEQIHPLGKDHPFAQTMFRHFDKLNTPLKSVDQYPTLESQRSRFLSRGWHRVETWDLWDSWSSDRFLSSVERAQLDSVEPFDEWEDFMLFARHHFVLHARASSSEATVPEPQLQVCRDELDGHSSHQQVKVTYRSEPKAHKRRFGSAMVIRSLTGERFGVHMAGMGSNGREATSDVYALGPYGMPPNLPIAGPAPRICHTTTDLGDVGILLAGGRGSSGSAMSDCWFFQKGADCCWLPTWSLPTPLFRHSVVRLQGSSLALVVGGKTGVSSISEDCFVLHPAKGWLKCDVQGTRPEPTFGAILCNSSQPSAESGIFLGLLAGGMREDGQIMSRKHLWRLDITQDRPVISFTETYAAEGDKKDRLSLFGGYAVDMGLRTIVCGGMGKDPYIQGQAMTVVTVSESGYTTTSLLPSEETTQKMPFMIGCSAVTSGERLIVVGGGATCFSMGTFWEIGSYAIDLPVDPPNRHFGGTPGATDKVEYVESRKTIAYQGDGATRQSLGTKATITSIPRMRLASEKDFQQVLQERKPVIIEGLSLGECVEKWQPGYMVERVGQQAQVTVHECERDTEKMDFNSKNFRYVTDTFGEVMARMEAGGRLYLRSLSHDRPSESPADIEQDFPSLAADFQLPPALQHVSEHIFSSVLRVSGRVNMWLHYDVMANVYVQVRGSKRMMLFPPGDVTQLCFAPGASSSSLDVFSALDTPSLAATHPHEAVLSPGDVLFLPPMWLHTATPTTDMSIAVNVFFRDLEGGYAAGRDVYGNRDLAAYEKGRQEAARISRGFEGLPGEIRRFYLARIADELVSWCQDDRR